MESTVVAIEEVKCAEDIHFSIDLIKAYKAEYTFECARMYYGEPPKNDWSKVFGITTFELG